RPSMRHAERVSSALDQGLTGSGVAIPDWASPSPCAAVAHEMIILHSLPAALNDLRLGKKRWGAAGMSVQRGGLFFHAQPCREGPLLTKADLPSKHTRRGVSCGK